MKVIFLGTNGWYSTKTGDTPCTLIDSEKYYIVLDAGNGIYKLDKYIKEDKPIFLFLSHFHLDHVFGLHITLGFKFKQGITIVVGKGGKENLNKLVIPPFTKNLKDFYSKMDVLELPNDLDKIPFKLEYFEMFHKDPDTGYRFNLDGKIVSYSGDTGITKNSIPLARNTDLLIHECTYPAWKSEKKWGHVNPKEAADLAKKANVKKLALVHFDADFYKTFADREEAQKAAREIFPNSFAMRDEQVIVL